MSGGPDLWNRKLTEYAQLLHKLEARLNAIESKAEAEKSRNDSQLLEFAELGEKMRRTYLRLSRIVKVDSDASSSPESTEVNNEALESDPRAIREAIDMSL